MYKGNLALAIMTLCAVWILCCRLSHPVVVPFMSCSQDSNISKESRRPFVGHVVVQFQMSSRKDKLVALTRANNFESGMNEPYRLMQSDSIHSKNASMIGFALGLSGFSKDGSTLLTVGPDQCLQLWNTKSWQMKRLWKVARPNPNQCVAMLAPNGRIVACLTKTGEGLSDLAVRDLHGDIHRVGYATSILGFSHNCRYLIYRSDYRYAVNSVLDLRTYKVCHRLEVGGAATAVSFDLHDNLLAIAKWDGSVEVVSVPGWKVVSNGNSSLRNITFLKFSASAGHIAACDGKNSVVIWSAMGANLHKSYALNEIDLTGRGSGGIEFSDANEDSTLLRVHSGAIYEVHFN
ncbi:MAG: WD40 repeat domain-containing protein [Chthonomonadales bacterium]